MKNIRVFSLMLNGWLLIILLDWMVAGKCFFAGNMDCDLFVAHLIQILVKVNRPLLTRNFFFFCILRAEHCHFDDWRRIMLYAVASRYKDNCQVMDSGFNVFVSVPSIIFFYYVGWFVF